jgi:hypothetical protein
LGNHHGQRDCEQFAQRLFVEIQAFKHGSKTSYPPQSNENI